MKQQRMLRNHPKKKISNQNLVHIQLDIKCSCMSNDATIQFTRRYLQCSSSMPIRIIRLFIGVILPHSPTIKVSIYDCHDRLLKDCDRLYSLKYSSNEILLRFTLINTITSLAHCSCLSSSIDEQSPMIIGSEMIDQVLSTCDNSMTTSSSSICPIDSEPDPTMVEFITSKYGEICSSPSEWISQENLPQIPLDLSLKSKSSMMKSFCSNGLFFHHRENSH